MKKILASLIFALLVLIGVEGCAMGGKNDENKVKYRDYNARTNYFGSRKMIPVQTAIALALKENLELLDTPIENITPLHLLIDPRGEEYVTTVKPAKYKYVKALQNMPVNFLTSTQVLGEMDDKDWWKDYLKKNKDIKDVIDDKGVFIFDVHDFVKNQPAILDAITDAMRHPCKYINIKNKNVWVEYNLSMVAFLGGEGVLQQVSPFHNTRGTISEHLKSYLEDRFDSILLKIKDDKACLNVLSERPFFNVLKYVNSMGQVSDIKIFEPNNKY